MLAALRGAGTTVLTNTFPDPSTVAPLFRRLAPRVAAYNERVRAAAARQGALVVDFDSHGVGTDLRIWSPDRIHANPLGHSLIAAAFADTLGLPGQAHWADPLPDAVPAGRWRRTAGDVRWLGRDVAPWLWRRARGRSSGDGIVAKRPRLLPVASLFHLIAPAEWPASGWYRPDSLRAEGFVHLSFADQVQAVANARYRDVEGLVAVELDPVALGVEIRIEDSYGEGATFPHVYGPVPVGAVVTKHPLRRAADGSWAFSPDPATAAASPDR
jgi:uncharacterized protein (DUF952 family)